MRVPSRSRNLHNSTRPTITPGRCPTPNMRSRSRASSSWRYQCAGAEPAHLSKAGHPGYVTARQLRKRLAGQTLGVDRNPGSPVGRKNVEMMQISMQEHGRLTRCEEFAKEQLRDFHERPRKRTRTAVKS